MRAPQFYILTTVAFLCLLLSIANVVLTQENQATRDKIELQREPLTEMRSRNQILETLVSDIAQAAEREPALRTLLTENGYKINFSKE